MHRIGIIGTGDIARKVYLPLLTGNPDVEIVALTSRTREKAVALARRHRLDVVVDDVGEVLQLKPDIVFIHASTSAHAELVRTCLDAGSHVYVDKPLSESLDETHRLEQQATAQGLLLAVGFNRRFAPMVRAAVEAVPNPTMIISEKHRRSIRPDRPFGTVYNDLIHAIDLACWAGAIPVDAVVQGAGIVDGDHLRAATAVLLASRCHAHVAMNRDAGDDAERLFIAGDAVSATVVNLDMVMVQESGTTTTRTFGSWDGILLRRGFVGLVDHVLNSLGAPEQCLVSATAVLRTHRVADQIARSLTGC
ncbi:Gfo/Idh/MocA family protein [Plantactinospora sp. KBS50]|uniref:Gfo/Idh/MocA family protein n=1 Tax=Plantactinospora sp. KBS50 TaxID=2024580 RepID=UPI0012FDC247|nr:Gfo/Idh/MocA family oxidoreductase [Plantactinospora sp. KBS50]